MYTPLKKIKVTHQSYIGSEQWQMLDFAISSVTVICEGRKGCKVAKNVI